ncbi:MAG: iron chelate uptake ABC transporter family permease subunit [Opitutales bacterium]
MSLQSFTSLGVRLRPNGYLRTGAVLVLLLCLPQALWGAKIDSLSDTEWWGQAVRFLSLRDPSVRLALLGSIFLGIGCGLLGSFIVVRKLALVGDTLSHAVLPGVALGFLWNTTKDPLAIFIGATIAGLFGTVVVTWIRQTTAIKEDSALGMVLAGFYGVGILLISMIQRMETSAKSGLDQFLFGQAAALGREDVILMGVVTGLAIVMILLFYKELVITSFDFGFARALGLPAQWFHHLIMLLLAFAVVVSLQAVGVVLVSAMLITPAASAYLLTDRMHRMLFIAAGFGMFAGMIGCFLSFLGTNLPTGPFMVLAASLLFLTAFLAGPRHGVIPRWLLHRNRSRRIQIENRLKAVYHVLEAGDFQEEGVSLGALAARRNIGVPVVEQEVRSLVKRNLVTLQGPTEAPRLVADSRAYLTPAGWVKASEIIRNHRLWELYLTHAADYEADHVHDDAEKIEHILGEETVRQLERRLNNPRRDPHGKMIPGLADIHQGMPAGRPPESFTGYTR